MRGLRRRLPSQFWPILAQLRAEEARLEAGAKSPLLEQLRLRLTEMEAQANFGLSYENLENFRAPQSLTQYRQGLSDSEVLFNFHLGTRQSFLWEATRDSLDAYRLPARDQIRSPVQGLREALESGNEQKRSDLEGEAAERAEELYAVSFEQVRQPIRVLPFPGSSRPPGGGCRPWLSAAERRAAVSFRESSCRPPSLCGCYLLEVQGADLMEDSPGTGDRACTKSLPFNLIPLRIS